MSLVLSPRCCPAAVSARLSTSRPLPQRRSDGRPARARIMPWYDWFPYEANRYKSPQLNPYFVDLKRKVAGTPPPLDESGDHSQLLQCFRIRSSWSCVEDVVEDGAVSVTTDLIDVNVLSEKVPSQTDYKWCMCGHSNTQPWCDGSHQKLAGAAYKPIVFRVNSRVDGCHLDGGCSIRGGVSSSGLAWMLVATRFRPVHTLASNSRPVAFLMGHGCDRGSYSMNEFGISKIQHGALGDTALLKSLLVLPRGVLKLVSPALQKPHLPADCSRLMCGCKYSERRPFCNLTHFYVQAHKHTGRVCTATFGIFFTASLGMSYFFHP